MGPCFQLKCERLRLRGGKDVYQSPEDVRGWLRGAAFRPLVLSDLNFGSLSVLSHFGHPQSSGVTGLSWKKSGFQWLSGRS